MSTFLNRFIIYLAFLSLIAGCNQNSRKEVEKAKGESADSTGSGLDELTSLIMKDSLNATLYRDRAELYRKSEKYNEALKDISTSIEIDSTRPDYFVTLADIYLNMGKIQPSVEALDKATSLNANNIPALLKLAEIYVVVRDYKKAVEYIDKVMKLDESQPKAYFFRGIVLLENGDTLHSIRNFQKAIDVDQDYFDAHLQLGLLYADKKNKLAVDYFNNALNIKPDNTDVSYYLAIYYQETGGYNEAIKIYEGLLLKDPKFYYALYNIGYINLVYLKDYNIAIDYFTKVIELKPEYTDAWYNRGFAYELQKDAENSRKDYMKALELTPNYEKAIDGLNRIDEYVSKEN